MLRASDDEAAGIRSGVNLALQVVHQFGNVLDLIENRTLVILRQKSPWIAVREVAGIQGFHRDVGSVRKGGLAEGGLAGLSWSRHRYDGIIARQFTEFGSQRARNHDANANEACMKCQCELQIRHWVASEHVCGGAER